MVQFVRANEGLRAFKPSRISVYYSERVIEGSISLDADAQLRDGFKTVAKHSVCDEKDWLHEYFVAARVTSLPATEP